MKIVVCINSMLSLQDTSLDKLSKTFLEEQSLLVQHVIEPSSAAALHIASSLCCVGDELIAATCSGPAGEAALEYALAYGVKSVVRMEEISSNMNDPTILSAILAEWLQEQSPDLIVCGNSNGLGVVPSLIAANLGITRIPRVENAKRKGSDALEITQRLDRGWKQRLLVRFPALISVQDGFFSTKYISVNRRKAASQKLYESIEVIHTDADERTKVKLLSVSPPNPRTKRTAIPDSSQSAANRLKALRGGGNARVNIGSNSKKEEPKIIEADSDQTVKEILEFLKKKELLPEK